MLNNLAAVFYYQRDVDRPSTCMLACILPVYSILSEITESLTKQYIDDSLLHQTNNTRSFIENSLNLHTNLFIIHAVFELTGADPTQVTSGTLCGPHHKYA